MPAEPATLPEAGRRIPPWMRSRRFIGAVSAIGGVQLMATMDGPVVVFALPRIQNELGLSDAGRSWVITAYMLTFGGLILLGGRLGDTIGRRRTFIGGVALFTAASVLCGIAWDGGSLVVARLLHGAAAAIVAPTCMALVATTFPKGPSRNAAAAVFGAMASLGAVLGLVVGGMLTGVSWRLAFLVNVPIGLLVIYLGRTMLQETEKERMKLDAAGAALATVVCTATVFGLSMGPEKGWLSVWVLGSAALALVGFLVFAMVERTAPNPVVPLSLFLDRSRVATFASMFLVRGVGFTLTVVIALYVQNIMGYTPLAAGISFIPFTIAMAVGTAAASRAVMRFSPRVVVIAGAVLLLGAILYGSTINRDLSYFPNLLVPMTVGAIGLGLINVPLGLSLIASVGSDRIGPASAVSVMLQSLGGPLVLVAVQVMITTRNMRLGGTNGPTTAMNDAQLDALDHGYTYGLMWLGAVVVLMIGVALLIGYTAQEVAHAQKTQKDQNESDSDDRQEFGAR
ncbi:MFS transporter [Mycobacterium sp. NBC_00419]|uniref:MFS transporter n=1 Tax=Mycobacterium sp. NBC_00419 TaxID=2975989 RepID=UPI002E1B84B7